MNPEILSTDYDKGALRVDICISGEDIAEALKEAGELLELEKETQLISDVDATRFEDEYVLAKAVNTAIKDLEIGICATTDVAPLSVPRDGSELKFYATVFPRPMTALTSIAPIDLSGNRIPVPGASMKAAREGADVEFIDDEKVLRAEIPNRLIVDLPEKLHQRLIVEHTNRFKAMLEANNTSMDTYKSRMNMDDEAFKGMMQAEATHQIVFDLALEEFFEALGLELEEEDIAATLEDMFPGEGEHLRKVFEMRGDMYVVEAQARRDKAFRHLKETAL